MANVFGEMGPGSPRRSHAYENSAKVVPYEGEIVAAATTEATEGLQEPPTSWHHVVRMRCLDKKAHLSTKVLWFLSGFILVLVQVSVLLSFSSALSIRRCTDPETGEDCNKGSYCAGLSSQPRWATDPLDPGNSHIARGFCLGCSSRYPDERHIPGLLEELCAPTHDGGVGCLSSCMSTCTGSASLDFITAPTSVEEVKHRVHVNRFTPGHERCAEQCGTSCKAALANVSVAAVQAFNAAEAGGALAEVGRSAALHTYVTWLSIVDQCAMCSKSSREHVEYATPAEIENLHIVKMSFFDFIALALASLIVALTMTREVRDMNIGAMMTLQALERQRRQKKLHDARPLVVLVDPQGSPAATPSCVPAVTSGVPVRPFGDAVDVGADAKQAVDGATTHPAPGVIKSAPSVPRLPSALEVVATIESGSTRGVARMLSALAAWMGDVVATEEAPGDDLSESEPYEMAEHTRVWRYLLGVNVFLRRYIILPEVASTVVLMVVRYGGDSVSIMLNTLAALFMLELDNLAFDYGLTAKLKAKADADFDVKLGSEQTWLLNWSRRWHVISLSAFFVVFINAVAAYHSIWERLRACSVALIALIAIGEAIELGARYKRRRANGSTANLERIGAFVFKIAVAVVYKWYMFEWQWGMATSALVY